MDTTKSSPAPSASAANDTSTQEQHRGLARFVPYFRNPENILRTKLDLFLLLWMFIAGIMKEMDQSATTQAYVSGMREDLGLLGNELN
ncbi:Major facilitator superfamily transporter [Apiospora rasikravindrae]|uniref:Major facilitator superfamily transporter n=1 Tax=Apiospora rasikravindrae TaxID=990691 RepID=A0ABR1TVZ6_9PEZI